MRISWHSSAAFLPVVTSLVAVEGGLAGTPPDATLSVGGASFQVLQVAEDPEWCYRFDVLPTQGKTGSRTVKLLFGYEDSAHYYALTLGARSALLTRRVGGRFRKLASYAGAVLATTGPTPVVLRRAASMVYVTVQGQRILGVMDSTFGAGRIALQATMPPVQVKEAHYQATADIVFGDDFMRTAGQQDLGEWTKVRGNWRFHSVKETNKAADFRLSVNPFSLGGHSTDWALVTAGYWFWDDYTCAVSVKSDGARCGLVFGYQGEAAFHLVRMDLSDRELGPRKVELLRVRGGKREVLAEDYVYAAAGQWFRLRVVTRGSALGVFLDGALLWRVVDPALVGGPVGLYTEGPRETYFDDVDVETNASFVYDRSVWWWRNARRLSGDWKLSRPPGRQPAYRGGGPVQMTQRSRGPATCLVGDPKWEDARLRTLVTAPERGTIGLVYDYHDARNFCRVELTGPADAPGSRIRFVRCVGGKSAVLAEAAGGYRRGRRNELRVDLSDADRAKFYLNDRLELMTDRASTPRGRMGLFTNGAVQTTFAQVGLSLEPKPDIEVPEEREAFVKDPYMLQWSSPRGHWYPVAGQPNTYWHKGDFYAAYVLTFPLLPTTRVTFAAPTPDFDKGYTLEVAAATEKGKALLTLSKLGKLKVRATVAVPKSGTFTLSNDGCYTWVTVGADTCLTYRDPDPLPGTRVGITSKQKLDPASFRVTRHRVKSIYFEKAPADWLQFGTWEITNRFSCTPTWSHMSGRSRYAAVLWSKYTLAGDYTIEYYAGMRMSTTKAMSYPRVGDMNVTFAAKTLDFSTGYSYLVGAWDPGWTSKWTKLLRGAKTVAQTDRPLVPRVRSHSGRRYIPVPYIASGRDVHGAWYYCKVRKLGKRIECYYDNVLALSYEDSDPLPGNRFGVWTYDNDMVIACVKVSYQHMGSPSPVVAPSRPEPTVAPPGAVRITARCVETPALFADFDQGPDGWLPATKELSSEVRAVTADPENGRACLEVRNLDLGGDFGVQAPVPRGLDLARVTSLRFRYRIPPTARLNLYLKTGNRRHFVHLTGAADSTPLLQSLGDAKIIADDRWHETNFDVAAAFRRLYPAAAAIPLQELKFGNFHPGYLAAGIGGNPFGCRYYLDDFTLAVAGPAKRSFTWTAAAPGSKKPAPALRYAVALDRSPRTKPKLLLNKDVARFTSPELADGLWYFHVRGRTGEGEWTPTTHVPVAVSGAPLRCIATTPVSDRPWGGTAVSFMLEPRTGLNLDLQRSSLTVNGTIVPLTSAAVQYDWRRRRLTFRAHRFPLAYTEGKPVTVVLTAATALSKPTRIAWTGRFTRALDPLPPSPVRLANPFVRDDFEDGSGGWSNLGGANYAWTLVDETTAAAGKRSLKVVNPVLTGSWGIRPTPKPFSVGKFPLLLFDYRLPEEVNADLLLVVGGRSRAVRFSDVDGSLPRLGAVQKVQADLNWHHAEVDLGRMVRSLPFARNQYEVTQFYFADTGYQGAAPGASFNLDNFTLVPVVSGVHGIRVKFVSHDPSGIARFRVKWSDKALDIPTGELPGNQPEQTFTVAREGLQYLHVQARDGAGNWNTPTHYPFLVDNTPPSVTGFTPPRNSVLGTRTVHIQFASTREAEVDPKSLVVSVNGKKYPLTAIDTSFPAHPNLLSWCWSLATGLFPDKVADGTRLTFGLAPVRDFAGNTCPAQTWTETIRYAADKEPPLPPEVTCSTHKSLVYDTFTRGTGKWTRYGTTSGATPLRAFDPKKGDYVLDLRLGSGSSYGAYAHSGDYDLAAYPFLSFDYRVPKGVKVFFHLYVNGSWYSVQFSSRSRSYKNLGGIPGVVADSRWHTAEVDLHKLVSASVKASKYTVKYIILSNYGGSGHVVSFDNFHLFGPGSNSPTFTWRAVDPTGIQGYSYTLDRSATTVPEAKRKTTEGKAGFANLKPGRYYFHLRAQDGAGNWGPPVHYCYVVR